MWCFVGSMASKFCFAAVKIYARVSNIIQSLELFGWLDAGLFLHSIPELHTQKFAKWLHALLGSGKLILGSSFAVVVVVGWNFGTTDIRASYRRVCHITYHS